MSLVLGAAHVASVPTVFSIANPVGLSVHLTGIPSYVPRDIGSPAEYHRLARLNLGNSLGYKPHLQLVTTPQLIYPIEPEYTLLSVNMISGVTVTIDEIASSTTLMPKPEPWDRSPVLVTQNAPVAVVAPSSATFWTYTVPAGRILLVQSLSIQLTRISVWTAASALLVDALLNGNPILELREYQNAVPYQLRDSLNAGPLVLPAGAVLSATYADSSTGGNHILNAQMQGYTFLV